MKTYVLSLFAGVLVGGIYGLLGVRSPAPPVIALLGLLGMLLGEQGIAIARRVFAGKAVTSSWISKQCGPPILETLEPHRAPDDAAAPKS